MRLTATLVFAVLAMITLSACPAKETDETGGTATPSGTSNQVAPGAQKPLSLADMQGDSAKAPTDETAGETGAGADANKPPADAAKTPKEDSNLVVLETTKGNIVIKLHPEWSPKGVEHFKELVNAGFYNGAPWFRVIDGFVAQTGVAADPRLNKSWEEKTIQDEPVVKGNIRGRVAYGQTGQPNSRSTHFFINYADNSRLDAQGFAAFGEVEEGMDVADKLTRCEYQRQDILAAEGGLAQFKKMFPNADYITKAYVGSPKAS